MQRINKGPLYFLSDLEGVDRGNRGGDFLNHGTKANLRWGVLFYDTNPVLLWTNTNRLGYGHDLLQWPARPQKDRHHLGHRGRKAILPLDFPSRGYPTKVWQCDGIHKVRKKIHTPAGENE